MWPLSMILRIGITMKKGQATATRSQSILRIARKIMLPKYSSRARG